jgi:hypothetical protein
MKIQFKMKKKRWKRKKECWKYIERGSKNTAPHRMLKTCFVAVPYEFPIDELPIDELPIDELPIDELPIDETSAGKK